MIGCLELVNSFRAQNAAACSTKCGVVMLVGSSMENELSEVLSLSLCTLVANRRVENWARSVDHGDLMTHTCPVSLQTAKYAQTACDAPPAGDLYVVQ